MFNPDVPIQTASDDVLGRHSFAEQLARAMISYNSPEAFTIGLYGPWGSGKTSVINLLEEELNEQSNDCIVVRFNPWLCSTPDQMISQFFEQLKSDIRALEPQKDIVADLGKFADVATQLCDAVGKYANALKLTRFIPGLNALGSIFEALGIGTEICQKLVGSDSNDEPLSLQDHKNRIHRILEEQKQKIIVIIDDLDRLSSDEIVAVFQLVKSLADFPYMIYLLAFDRDIVVKALEDVQKGDGNAYLEKIVQMPFEIPRASNIDIEQVFLMRLEEMVQGKEYCARETDWELLFDEGIRPYLTSIRDVTRYMNTFALKYAMLKNETDLLDLIALTCIQVFEPQMFSQLPYYSDVLCGTEINWFQEEEEKVAHQQTIYNSLMASVSDEKKEVCSYILSKLFPAWARKVDPYGSHEYHSPEEYLRCHRICSRECFDRYFMLNLERNGISDATIQYLVFQSDQDGFVQQIQLLIANGKMDRFLREFEAYFDSAPMHPKLIPEDRAMQLIIWFCEQWEMIHKVVIFSIFEPCTLRYKLLKVILELLKMISAEMRYDVVKTIMSSSEIPLGVIRGILGDLERYHNRFVKTGRKYSDTVVTLTEVKELETVFMERTLEDLRAGTLLSEEDASDIFWLMEKIDAERSELSQMKVAVQEYLSDDVFLAKLVAIHGSSDEQLDYTIWKSDTDMIMQYVDLKEAAARIEHFLSSDVSQLITEKEKRELAVFLVARDLKNREGDEEILDDMVNEKLNALAAD